MTIVHEPVAVLPRLPFKFYQHDPLTTITVQPHWHQGIELNYLVAGEALTFVTDGHPHTYHPGDVWAVNRRIIHSARGAEQVRWNEFGLIIDDAWLTQAVSASTHWHLDLNAPGQSAARVQLIDHLLAIQKGLQTAPDDLRRLTVLSHFYAAIVLLGTAFTTNAAATTVVTANQSLVNNVMTAINQRYAEPLSGQSLATEFHVSLTTLHQQFKASLQVSVNRYIRRVRLMRADQLLLASDQPVEVIALRCGFSSRKTFNRNFQAWKGLSPTAYRQTAAHHPHIDQGCV
ncbi:AraC family transcriptional regulator [Lactiplantibacillus modestisalitolerans]|uniref:Helix-turn-helix domain-containing protein n=1 Tax=Lactiplantibacillus modestisalitolerans TaxID=1457219 RepID=A0ABV5WU13_9LACO|nr:AraC family transcriptional regulator [Lactiplantibacillus modestisalitolerans]